MLLEICNTRSGAVLNRHDGIETADALIFPLEGLASPEATVTVNGVVAERNDQRFFCDVRLTRKINHVAVKASSQFGDCTLEVVLVWDKASFRRYHFFLDDHIFTFADLAKNRPARAFDHFYLKKLQELHRDFGTKFSLNCFYHNSHFDFDLCQMPDCYRQEFIDNSDWLRLSFHAHSEFPDRPYQFADEKQLAADYDLVRAEIIRFAGEESFIPPITIHWAMVKPDCFGCLKERGMNILEGQYLSSPPEGGTAVSEVGASRFDLTDVGFFYEKDVAKYVQQNMLFYDRFTDMFLLGETMVCNLNPLDRIAPLIRAASESRYHKDYICICSHEQYSFPHYFNYQADHLEKLAVACRTAREEGYASIFHNEGLYGNCAWEK